MHIISILFLLAEAESSGSWFIVLRVLILKVTVLKEFLISVSLVSVLLLIFSNTEAKMHSLWLTFIQLAGAVEYSDCTSTEG